MLSQQSCTDSCGCGSLSLWPGAIWDGYTLRGAKLFAMQVSDTSPPPEGPRRRYTVALILYRPDLKGVSCRVGYPLVDGASLGTLRCDTEV
jgi:hypothetical protein